MLDLQNQVDESREYPENGTAFEKITYRLNRDSLAYAFVEQFYQEIFRTERYDKYDLFSKYPGAFVNEKAARDLENDIVYSFAEFVVQDEPTGDSIIEKKIRFFYNYPELVTIREQLRHHM